MFNTDSICFVSFMTEDQENAYFAELREQGLIDEELEAIIRANVKVARLNNDSNRVRAMTAVADILKVKNPDLWGAKTTSEPGKLNMAVDYTAVNCRCAL